MSKREKRIKPSSSDLDDDFDDRVFEIIVFTFLLSTAAIATGAAMAFIDVM